MPWACPFAAGGRFLVGAAGRDLDTLSFVLDRQGIYYDARQQ